MREISGPVIFTLSQKRVLEHLAQDPYVIEVTKICPNGDWADVIYDDPEYGRGEMIMGDPLIWEIE